MKPIVPEFDEGRDPRELEYFIAERFTSNPLEAREKYVGLVARYNKSSRKLNNTERKLAQVTAQLKSLRKEDKNFSDKISGLEARLKKEELEAKRLARKVEQLQRSESYKLGNAVVKPVKSLLGLARLRSVDKGTGASNAEQEREPGKGSRPVSIENSNSSRSENASKNAADGARSPQSAQKKISEHSLEELYARYSGHASAKNLDYLLNRLWFSAGAVTAIMDLSEDIERWAGELSPASDLIYERAEALNYLYSEGFRIPLPGPDPAYVVDNSSVLYVAHDTPVFSQNGYAVRTRGIASALTSVGLRPTVLGRPGYPWDQGGSRAKRAKERLETRLDGVSYVHLPAADLARIGEDKYFELAIDAVIREARKQRASLIIGGSDYHTAYPGLVAARILGVPFIYEVRGLWELSAAASKPGWAESDRYRINVELENRVMNASDALFVITDEVREHLKARGVQNDQMIVIPNGTDTKKIAPISRDSDYAKKWSVSKESFVIGFAGSIVTYEGLHTLVEAMKLIKSSIDVTCLIAGEGNALPALKERVIELGLQERVKFVGKIPNSSMVRFLSLLDLYVCPRVSEEVTELVSPLKPLEAFSAGVPLLLSNVSPHLTFAADESRAALFPAGNVSALANKITDLIQEPQRLLDMKRTARRWVVSERDWKVLGSVLYRAIQNIQLRQHDHNPNLRRLSDLRVGYIGDEFTRATLSEEVKLLEIHKGQIEELEALNLDVVFIESAWHGNGGEWHRAVGYYSDHESKKFDDLIQKCHALHIPTLFWNKEDPVHYNRFIPNALKCDYIFTVDSNMISKYREEAGRKVTSIASMPFYASAAIHSPIITDETLVPTAAYAGTYYGNRYKERSKALVKMLEVAQETGLTIYDRQALNPESPYSFPSQFTENILGGLEYRDVLRTYRSHLAHLNGNSVTDSPTMFSRRVVEIASSGGCTISSPSKGMSEIFGDIIPASTSSEEIGAFLFGWLNHPEAWKAERWRQFRFVRRAFSARTALALMFRRMGVNVLAEVLPGVQVNVKSSDNNMVEKIVHSVVTQSVLPKAVSFVDTFSLSPDLSQLLRLSGIEVLAHGLTVSPDRVSIDIYDVLDRYQLEDILHVANSSPGDDLDFYVLPDADGEWALARQLTSREVSGDIIANLRRTHQEDEGSPYVRAALGLARFTSSTILQEAESPTTYAPDSTRQSSVLIAGHDLKFIRNISEVWRMDGYEVETDNWAAHNSHNPDESLEKLSRADIIVCEWGLGNAVWYSANKNANQKLIVRVHLQELDLPYLKRINHSAVDCFIFVSEYVRRSAIESHGIPASKAFVVPNAVARKQLHSDKYPNASKTIGFVGIVPQRKRLDLAIDLMESLLAQDSSYVLRIKGHRPEDFEWMKNRHSELEFYSRQYERIDALNEVYPGSIIFDDFSTDISDWYRHVGFVLSVSDFESFHMTIADGVASGAHPLILAWDAAEFVYPASWLSENIEQLKCKVLQTDGAREFSGWADISAFDVNKVARQVLKPDN